MFDKLIIRKIFNFPKLYSVFQTVIGKKGIREDFLLKNIVNFDNKSVLDLGCGTANILEFINNESLYVGIDNNQKYINYNKKTWGHRENCVFFYGDLNDYVAKTSEKFDVVLMFGVMHHIDDAAVKNCLDNIKKLLKPGGFFVSHDPCYTKKMNFIAKIICKLDRGRYVRYEEEYVKIQKQFFLNVKYVIRKDCLHFFPYSVIYFCNSDK